MFTIYFLIFNIISLIILYTIHRRIFWITFGIELVIFVVGSIYIEKTFSTFPNHFLYYSALTGIGLAIGLIAFFVAIILNQKHIYSSLETKKP